MSKPQAILSYRAFWPFYLRQHAKAGTRYWHMAGTAVAVPLLIAALGARSTGLFAASLMVGYGPAWFAHFLIERNSPATWRFPLWSLFSDFRMLVCWLDRTLAEELRKAGVE
jgi:hypothetical protein